MSFSKVNDSDVRLSPGPHPASSPYDKLISKHLGLSAFDVYKVDLPPAEQTMPHDHVQDGVEDMYAIVRGTGWLVVDGEREPLKQGDFVAVRDTGATRHIVAGEHGCHLIAVCA